MLTKTREVYYCEYCKRHRLTASAILNHEPRCIYNPERAACGWHRDRGVPRPADLVAAFIENGGDVPWLHDHTEGCPACMLAVVVQAREEGFVDSDFVYSAEVERFRKEEREAVDVW